MSRPRRQDREEKRPAPWRELLERLFVQFRDELVLILAGAVAALAQAMFYKVQTGETGLLFSFGRARRELRPGVHFLIPFVWRARKMPTRSRTLDLPFQQVVNQDGLVMFVDANLVYRVTEVRKAMIEIDQLEKGMLQMLGLGVQEVLRSTPREEFRQSGDLDRRLATNLARRLAPWGVSVEHAGFPSISPSPHTLRITQLGARVDERRRGRDLLVERGVASRRALPLIGTRTVPRARIHRKRELEFLRRRERRLLARAKQEGWTGADIKRAGISLRARMTARVRSRAASAV